MASSLQEMILKAPGEGLIEEMKQLKAENVELKKELLRLQGIEDQLQLLREENEMLKEQNASLKLQAKVRQLERGPSTEDGPCIDLSKTATQTLLDSARCSDKEEMECRPSDGATDKVVKEGQEHTDLVTEGKGHTDLVMEDQGHNDFVKKCQGHTDFVKQGQRHSECGLEGQGRTDFVKEDQGHADCISKIEGHTDMIPAKTVPADFGTPQDADPPAKYRRSAQISCVANTRKSKRLSVRWETGRRRRMERKEMAESREGAGEKRPGDSDVHDEDFDQPVVQFPSQQHSIPEQCTHPSARRKSARSKKLLAAGKKEHASPDTPDSKKVKTCPECSFTTLHSKSLWRHIRNRHRGQRYKCQQCDKQYHYESGLKTHIETIHTKELDICSVCGLSMHRSRLKYHIQSVHHGTGNFTCELCGKIFEKKSCYIGHVNKHFDVKQFQCENCGKTFYYETSLCGHKKNCLKQIAKKARKLSAAPSVFICDVCAREFKTVCAMREHVQAKHSNNSYECMCGRSYSWRPSFKRHERKCKMLNETENQT